MIQGKLALLLVKIHFDRLPHAPSTSYVFKYRLVVAATTRHPS
jgi:hypothetical protein